jgi:hypothetical protein
MDSNQMKKILLILKKNWQILLLVFGFIFSIFLFRRRDQNFVERLEKIQDDHKKEIQKINEIREKERKQHEENESRLKETLALIQTKYDLSKKELDDKKKKQIQEIVEKHGSNPDELAVQLSNVTGFKIIPSEKD